eukprot:TRINITY_DN2116_c0_g1_i1.p1 TRINITY_DN2116_c0_g1~~TRINITY_DN2116_c0_g1_i1.p1  ORF type:complete len:101 (-),score=9.94 TRINITY_DN2116_c0_g1_i1:1096-1398(-)
MCNCNTTYYLLTIHYRNLRRMLLALFFFFLMIRRPPRSTLSSSSAASDVYKRQGYSSQRVIKLSILVCEDSLASGFSEQLFFPSPSTAREHGIARSALDR